MSGREDGPKVRRRFCAGGDGVGETVVGVGNDEVDGNDDLHVGRMGDVSGVIGEENGGGSGGKGGMNDTSLPELQAW